MEKRIRVDKQKLILPVISPWPSPLSNNNFVALYQHNLIGPKVNMIFIMACNRLNYKVHSRFIDVDSVVTFTATKFCYQLMYSILLHI